jgi:hypothetical protein
MGDLAAAVPAEYRKRMARRIIPKKFISDRTYKNLPGAISLHSCYDLVGTTKSFLRSAKILGNAHHETQ